jgi:predicted nucleic acid-binding protein
VGLILDSSVAIAAERRGDTVQAFLQRVIDTAGDQQAALSPVGVVELVHGIHRADTAERRARREEFVEELLSTVAIYPLTTDIARLAGKLDAEQQSRGIVVPFADLLIGATALSLGYSVLGFRPLLPTRFCPQLLPFVSQSSADCFSPIGRRDRQLVGDSPDQLSPSLAGEHLHPDLHVFFTHRDDPDDRQH